MVVSLIIFALLGILGLVSAGESTGGEKRKMLLPFWKMGVWTARHTGLQKMGQGKDRLRYDLKALEQEEGYAAEQQYYARKLETVFLVLFIGSGMAAFAAIAVQDTGNEVRDTLERPAFGQSPAEEELKAVAEGEKETNSILVTVTPRQLTDEEIKEAFLRAEEEIEESLPGENSSLDEVRGGLKLIKTAAEGTVEVDWTVTPFGIIDDGGAVTGEVSQEGELVNLSAELSCQDQKAEYKAFARIYPPKLDEKGRFLADMEEAVAKADQEGINEDIMVLPREISGRNITWVEEGVPLPQMICAFSLLAAVCMYFRKDSDIHKRAGLRRRQLILDYPQMLFKMSMLLGAGLTIREAFTKIAFEYRSSAGKDKRAVYEEMLYSCREMQRGVAEADAYENFGRRCQETCYVKLGAVLAQHLKKGSKGLGEFLETEAINALEERRQMVQKMGEEAGTKLLLPMMLMLILVLVILMVPAVMSF